MPHRLLAVFAVCALTLTAACNRPPEGSSLEERRQYVLHMRDETLAKLYQRRPELRMVVEDAPGYAVFSNVGVHVVFAGGGYGYGVVEEASGQRTYMRMGEAGVGFGLGAKDFRVVFVFRNDNTMRRFVDEGWEFSGDADAAAREGTSGAASSASVNVQSVRDDMLIYQFTEAGLALQATVSGTKYWRDKDLNG